MSSRWADELSFAIDLSRGAGEILTRSYERIERIDYKSKRDVVTDADYASERLVIDAIKARYPGDAILAEESANGEFRFVFAPLAPDTAFDLKVDLQVNPDIVGGNDGLVTVYDGERALVGTRISITVLP